MMVKGSSISLNIWPRSYTTNSLEKGLRDLLRHAIFHARFEASCMHVLEPPVHRVTRVILRAVVGKTVAF